MVRIVADSTCDLPQELVERYEVSILPLHILLGEEEYEDGISISPDEIYQWSEARKTTPKTSAPSLESAKRLMAPLLEPDNELVCFSISEEMSMSANVMRMAAKELDAEERVYVIDSQNLSAGVGLLVIEAAVLAKEGKNGSQISERIQEIRNRVRVSFVVDTLVYLHRGGRCGGLTAMLGSTLRLHPQIVVENGKMHSAKKYRGNMSRVIMSYVRDLEPDLQKAQKERLFIVHSGDVGEKADIVYEYLAALQIFEEIRIVRAGGVISSHCGPGTLGIMFIEKAGGGTT